MKRADVQFVDDRILIPQGIVVEHDDVFMMAHAALLVRAEEHTRVLTENITGIAPFIDDLVRVALAFPAFPHRPSQGRPLPGGGGYHAAGGSSAQGGKLPTSNHGSPRAISCRPSLP